MKKMTLILSMTFLFLVAALALGTAGCSRSQDLQFETLDHGVILDNYFGPKQPHMLILSQPEEVDNPTTDVSFPAELAGRLRSVDYKEYFVTVLFYGQIGFMAEEVNINAQTVVRSGKRVILTTSLSKRPNLAGAALSSPYRIITVAKPGRWNREIIFILEVDGKEIERQKHFVP